MIMIAMAKRRTRTSWGVCFFISDHNSDGYCGHPSHKLPSSVHCNVRLNPQPLLNLHGMYSWANPQKLLRP